MNHVPGSIGHCVVVLFFYIITISILLTTIIVVEFEQQINQIKIGTHPSLNVPFLTWPVNAAHCQTYSLKYSYLIFLCKDCHIKIKKALKSCTQ